MSAINQTEVFSTDYLIEPNPQFDFNHKSSDAYVVQNIAEDVNYTEVSVTSQNKYQLTFQVDPANLFLSRGFTLNLDLPLIFTRGGTALTTAPDKDDYVTKFFGNYASFAWKQFGFCNAIQSIAVTMDGLTYTVTDIPEMLKIVSRYYDETIVHQRIPASLPDCMDYDNYAQGSDPVSTVALDSQTEMMIKPSIIKSHDIFDTVGNPDYNSRTPMVSFTSATTTTLTGSIIGETCFIPFSIFGLAGLDTQPLVGVKSMSIKIQLKSNWTKHLFSTKGGYIAGVMFDDAKLSNFKAAFRYKTYNAPVYIDQAHNLSSSIPDYNMKFQICELQNSVQQVDFAANKKQVNVPILTYKIKAIPKAIYIAATLKPENDDDVINTPDVFCRIDDLQVEVAGKKTILPNSPTGLMQIAKANGYQDSMEIGYFLGGFPLKLNMTDDLAAKSNSLVGSRNNIQNEIRISNLRLTNVARAGKACKYDIRLICVYDGMISHQNGKFKLFESLLEAEENINVEAHVSALYNAQIQKMNMIGGSFGSLFAAALPTLKKLGTGAYNVVKRFATDKKFRGHVMDAFNNAKAPGVNFVEKMDRPVNFVEQASGGRSSHTPYGGSSNVIGGFSSALGGRAVGQIRY